MRLSRSPFLLMLARLNRVAFKLAMADAPAVTRWAWNGYWEKYRFPAVRCFGIDCVGG